jgi:hypothetical protein
MNATTADMRLDGNAIGGLLLEVFGIEVTASFATCASCGTRGELARVIVYARAAGIVARCPACDAVLLTVVEGSGRRWVSLRGLRTLELPVG